jgi:hypothetical protein
VDASISSATQTNFEQIVYYLAMRPSCENTDYSIPVDSFNPVGN